MGGVPLADILANNESLKTAGSGLTAVFLGATNGIGLGALQSLVKNTTDPTIYVVGRSRSRLDALFSDLHTLNATATLVPIEANDLTLVSDADKAAHAVINSDPAPKRIDLLLMSPGYITFTHELSPEGLERCQTIRYYARMRFLLTLLPLVRASPNPRIVSVLAGGMEGPLFPTDWQLLSNFGIVAAAGAATSQTTLFFEQLAAKPENARLTFVHLYPGTVGGTGLTIRGVGAVASFLLRWVAQPLMRVFGYTPAEAGERVVFAATNGRFRKLAAGVSGEGTLVQKGSDGVVGSGIYLVNAKSSVVPGNKVLDKLRKDNMGAVVEEHTMEELERIAKM